MQVASQKGKLSSIVSKKHFSQSPTYVYVNHVIIGDIVVLASSPGHMWDVKTLALLYWHVDVHFQKSRKSEHTYTQSTQHIQ